jgi:ergothioneine biosynthesis protein EgtB
MRSLSQSPGFSAAGSCFEQDVSRAAQVLKCYESIRSCSEHLCIPLEPEDCVVQSMPDASPVRWHLAHSTWFFETLVLKAASPKYRPWKTSYDYLFNSYYNAVGPQFPRGFRGTLSRPTVREVLEYRHFVDEQIRELLQPCSAVETESLEDWLAIIELGLHHEQQHQELILTDIKHAFWSNPMRPAYAHGDFAPSRPAPMAQWSAFGEGLRWIGSECSGFAYDNECPKHQVYLPAFELATRPVTNGEYMQFMADGGYQQAALWLSDGWDLVQQEGWNAPLYWEQRDGEWWCFTLFGMRPVDPHQPVCHVSYFEAAAFAEWANGRLPTEAEWESAVGDLPVVGNFAEESWFHPLVQGSPTLPQKAEASLTPTARLAQMYGDVWEWTASPYAAYPGYRPPEGPVGEYNGKFMCNQFVLRGGSCATPRSHMRPTYRNFFAPQSRWQFAGIRLAR